ncbi:MAG: hypothetical protein IKT56_02730 [Clostridia bacterium]|nr:hypothetical protein [Clostridia bacterium]
MQGIRRRGESKRREARCREDGAGRVTSYDRLRIISNATEYEEEESINGGEGIQGKRIRGGSHNGRIATICSCGVAERGAPVRYGSAGIAQQVYLLHQQE